MRKTEFSIEKINEIILVIIIFFMRLPPIYLLPFGGIFVMTHNITRFFIVVIFVSSIYLSFKKKEQIILDRRLILVVSLFFLGQSLSVLAAKNIIAFLSSYKDIVFAILMLFVTFFIVTKKNIHFFIMALLASSLINILFQLITYFFPHITFNYISPFFYEKYLHFFEYQFNRNRFFGDSFDEIMIPLIILYLIQEKKFINKLFYILFTILIIFVTLISNWRTKAVIFIFVFFTSIYKLRKRIKNHAFTILVILVSAIAVSSFLSSGVIKTSVLTRFLFEEEETKTITSRVSYWKDALEIGLRSPFVGVGLGNYFDNLSTSSKKTNETSQIDRYRKFIFIDDPHSIFFSIFATTGIIGLLSFLSVLSFFLIRDLSGIRSQNELPTLIICMFWGLFIFSLMNPWVNFSYLSFMFLIRGFCEKLRLSIPIKNKNGSIQK